MSIRTAIITISNSKSRGEGEDTAVYLLDSSRYTVTRSDSGVYYLNSWESLRNVEYLRFADTIVAIDSLI